MSKKKQNGNGNNLNNSIKSKTKSISITAKTPNQKKLLKSIKENIVTIVAGPPGTGKSQVVINIIANAVARGEGVLFGSKNHQAVDVVLQRIYEIQEQPMVLKFGQNAKESIFAERLLSSVDTAMNCTISIPVFKVIKSPRVYIAQLATK